MRCRGWYEGMEDLRLMMREDRGNSVGNQQYDTTRDREDHKTGTQYKYEETKQRH